MKFIVDECKDVNFPLEMMARVRFTRMYTCIVDESRTLGFFVMEYIIPGAFSQTHNVSVILTARSDVRNDTWDVAESIGFFIGVNEALSFVNEKIIKNASLRQMQFISAYDMSIIDCYGFPQRNKLPVYQMLLSNLRLRQ